MAKITRAGFAVIAVVGVGVLWGGAKLAVMTGLIGKPAQTVSAVPVATTIQHFTVADHTTAYPLPVTAQPANMTDCPVMEVLAWNAHGGLTIANGGSSTSRGSLVEKYTGNGCLTIKRQDDYGQMEANMAAFVTSNGARGDAFFTIMGDGYPYVAAALQKLIPGQFAAIGVIGFSDGEDKCMMPSDAQKDPKKAKGVLVAAVPRDGDWNICVKWASDNGIPINTDQKTYDADAINFMDVDAFTTADEKLISHACEDRLVVSHGITHGTKKVCVNGVATWTPGDVDVVSKFDGSIVGVASTHDYAGQMPTLIIGVKSWMQSHHDYVVGLLKAADRGAILIRTSSAALMDMGGIHAQIFHEQDASYWARYFKGEIGHNRLGEEVSLGGSKVITLQEARDYFGIRSGTENIFASVYRVFKGYDEAFYPTDYPKSGSGSIPAYDDVVDLSYLTDALQGVPEAQGVAAPQYASAAPITQTVSKRAWHIEFNSGSATVKASSIAVLTQIEDTAVMTNLRLRLDGYTDNTGNPQANVALSQQRAAAVANWLTSKAPANFPASRLEIVGHGQDMPVCASNDTAACKAQNRRVEITLGQ
jgi:outer membrane protein OmpA-like peptidoglycan-associated protein